ncbi:hypothetical protein E1B28_008868 [Marasmius oreades]|uniref:Alpha N-terminal protein methyltransferase 1 n=1 Tax=Marasmius oreades TaxID=181124 RepID=A0A9P7RZE7_9AGAR|nr:uncharacterized protein E1B28_008868 [Marasmius oreades]KAG7092517.1 hypothetical protein E1B28_008868 [Marasmius oreades]
MVQPNVSDGIAYWTSQPATVDGVLGGFGSGSLPRVESLGSRLFLLSLFPELCTVPSAVKPLNVSSSRLPIRALDVGAGIGRVTRDTLLHLIPHVVLLEPVESFILQALSSARLSVSDHSISKHAQWPGLADKSKSVTFIQCTLQGCDPSHLLSESAKYLNRVGSMTSEDPMNDIDSGFDVIWCQWCLGHLKDDDLIAFFKRSKIALRQDNGYPGRSLIVVKENLCSDSSGGGPRTTFDEEDSSFTRSDAAWKTAFSAAGLEVVREQVQKGLPEGLYPVKMYGLR